MKRPCTVSILRQKISKLSNCESRRYNFFIIKNMKRGREIMVVTCNDSFGIQEVSLPYLNLEHAVQSIKSVKVEKEKLKLFCEKIEDTAKVFFLYVVNEMQANMGIFNSNEYVGEYSHNGEMRKVYIKEAEDR